jgi:hypothetical protein
VARHTAAFSRPEFLKAVRALSSRYVEARATLTTRSPLDSAGKRAAFAAFYAPLHFLVVREITGALPPIAPRTRILDLGCGTGVAGLAWATTFSPPPAVTGADVNPWALDEMRWNCRQLGVAGRTRRQTMVDAVDEASDGRRREPHDRPGIVCGWSLNELPAPDRDRLLTTLVAIGGRAAVLIVEPLALSAVPWWNTWRGAVADAGGRADEWRFDRVLPPVLAELDEAAGFRRQQLTARSFWLPGG